jgi:hypothetical protein
MKTVIHVWTHHFNINQERLKKYNTYNETEFYFGLGDLLRSTIKMYDLSKTMGFKFEVNLQLHPIAPFLKKQASMYDDYVIKNKNNIDYVCYNELEDYINESTNEILYILSNDFYQKNEISNDCKEFIKNIMTPTLEFDKYIDYVLSKIPFKQPYNILHYRLNDDEFKNKNSSKSLTYLNELTENVNKNKESNDILISDSSSFKQYIFLNTDIFLFETKICHLGLSTDKDAIRDTLFEYFLLTRSSKIKTYCKIHEISGFVKWVSKIYDIPIIKL